MGHRSLRLSLNYQTPLCRASLGIHMPIHRICRSKILGEGTDCGLLWASQEPSSFGVLAALMCRADLVSCLLGRCDVGLLMRCDRLVVVVVVLRRRHKYTYTEIQYASQSTELSCFLGSMRPSCCLYWDVS